MATQEVCPKQHNPFWRVWEWEADVGFWCRLKRAGWTTWWVRCVCFVKSGWYAYRLGHGSEFRLRYRQGVLIEEWWVDDWIDTGFHASNYRNIRAWSISTHEMHKEMRAFNVPLVICTCVQEFDTFSKRKVWGYYPWACSPDLGKKYLPCKVLLDRIWKHLKQVKTNPWSWNTFILS